MQVMCLAEDSHGFIWAGTKGGLARWDGNKFSVWNSRTPGFTSSSVYYMEPLADGSNLVHTIKRLWLIRGASAYAVKLADTIKFFGSLRYINESKSLLVDCNASLPGYASHPRLNYILDNKSGKLTAFRTRGFIIGVINDSLFYSYEAMPGDKCLRYALYLYCYSTLCDSITNLSCFYNANWGKGNVGNGNYIMADIHGDEVSRGLVNCAYEVAAAGLKFSLRKLLLQRPVPAKGTAGVRWIPVSDSSYYYVDEALALHHVSGSDEEQLGTVGIANSYVIDRRGNLWLGTEQGLYCFYSASLHEYKFGFSPGSEDNVWSMAKGKDGRYYIAVGKKGIYSYNDISKAWNREPIHLADRKLDAVYTDEINNGTFCATRLWDGNVLLPLAHGFAVKKDKKIVTYLPIPGAETYAAVTDTLRHCAYIAQYSALYRLNTDYTLDTLGSAIDMGLKCVVSATVTSNGMPVFSGVAAKNSVVSLSDKQFSSLPVHMHSVISMCADKHSGIWLLATDSLYYYSQGKTTYVPIPARSLSLSVANYHDKWLIVGGVDGFILLDLVAWQREKKIIARSYNYNNGFYAIECSQNSMLVDDDGTVWIPTAKSVMRVNPADISGDIAIDPPVIDAVSFSGMDFNWVTDTGRGALRQRYPYRNIQFKFIASAINSTGPLQYRYRLLGYNSDWSAPGEGTVAVFSDMPPGKYRFEVSSSNNGTDWSIPTATGDIILVPRVTEQPLFIIIICAIVIAVIAIVAFTIIRRYIRNRHKAQAQNIQVLTLQLRSLRSKALPHFTGNVFHNIDYLIESRQYDNASRYLARLSRLYNAILLDAEKASRSLADELEFTANYLELEKLRFKSKLGFSFNVDPGVDSEIQVPNMVVYTYVENAIKHGLMNKKGNWLINIDVSRDTDGLRLSVTDNGIGRQAAAAGHKSSTGMGLIILDRQIDIYNEKNEKKIICSVEDLEDIYGTPGGTRFSMYIPFGYKYRLS